MRRPLPIRTTSTTLRRLFEIAEKNGVTYSDIAIALNTSASLIYNWKAGRNAPSILSVEALGTFLRCRLNIQEETE